jgi:hypothetical protein
MIFCGVLQATSVDKASTVSPVLKPFIDFPVIVLKTRINGSHITRKCYTKEPTDSPKMFDSVVFCYFVNGATARNIAIFKTYAVSVRCRRPLFLCFNYPNSRKYKA